MIASASLLSYFLVVLCYVTKAAALDQLDANEDPLHYLRGHDKRAELSSNASHVPRKILEGGVAGDCRNTATFLGIPFSASAYDVCSFFFDTTSEKYGICGDPTSALDSQPNNDTICLARAGIKGDCHVAFTAPGEYIEYSFNIDENEHSERAVFNIILRVAAKQRRTVRVIIDNGGDYITQDLEVEGTGFSDFQDVIWERVRIPGRGPERIFIEFVDGMVNFCNLRVEETTLILDKKLVIPFDKSSDYYVSFYERTPEIRMGTCGPGPVDAQPTSDPICNQRGSYCNIAWTEYNEHLIYWVENPNSEPSTHAVTL